MGKEQEKIVKDWTIVQWKLPRWAAETIVDTLEMDAQSIAFSLELRSKIQRALDVITETDLPAVQQQQQTQQTGE